MRLDYLLVCNEESVLKNYTMSKTATWYYVICNSEWPISFFVPCFLSDMHFKNNDLNLTFLSSAVSIYLISIVTWCKRAPRSFGLNSDTAVVSSSSVNKREHAAVTS